MALSLNPNSHPPQYSFSIASLLCARAPPFPDRPVRIAPDRSPSLDHHTRPFLHQTRILRLIPGDDLRAEQVLLEYRFGRPLAVSLAFLFNLVLLVARRQVPFV